MQKQPTGQGFTRFQKMTYAAPGINSFYKEKPLYERFRESTSQIYRMSKISQSVHSNSIYRMSKISQSVHSNSISSMMEISNGFNSDDWKSELIRMKESAPSKFTLLRMLETGYRNFDNSILPEGLKLKKAVIYSNISQVKSLLLACSGAKCASIAHREIFEGEIANEMETYGGHYAKGSLGRIWIAFDGKDNIMFSRDLQILSVLSHELERRKESQKNGLSDEVAMYDKNIGSFMGYGQVSIMKYMKDGNSIATYYRRLGTNKIYVQPEAFTPIFVPAVIGDKIQDRETLKSWENEFAALIPAELRMAYAFIAKFELLESIKSEMEKLGMA